MQKCPVPILVDRVLDDLARIKSGASAHRASNYRMVARSIGSLCRYPDCPGADVCADRSDNLRILEDLRLWIVTQWRNEHRARRNNEGE